MPHNYNKPCLVSLRGLPNPESSSVLGSTKSSTVDLLMHICVAVEQEKILAISVNVREKEDSTCAPMSAHSLSSAHAVLNSRDEGFNGVVPLDQAYIDLSEPNASAFSLVRDCVNACIMSIKHNLRTGYYPNWNRLRPTPIVQILTNIRTSYNHSHSNQPPCIRRPLSTSASMCTTFTSSCTALLRALSAIHDVGTSISGNEANPLNTPPKSLQAPCKKERRHRPLLRELGVPLHHA
ncbi:hypothetical protein BDQ12DRAFT_669912 [Crucibulum laeve]|uniref:Uncharacterized protein n=1 Tax=Crucibulum laeve TaxID=68775 RepID=A0A5C3LPH0_9AGAR|nr:hypothetical protein BDQ12DRAFT_669912 [Crucibulum laeve]